MKTRHICHRVVVCRICDTRAFILLDGCAGALELVGVETPDDRLDGLDAEGDRGC